MVSGHWNQGVYRLRVQYRKFQEIPRRGRYFNEYGKGKVCQTARGAG